MGYVHIPNLPQSRTSLAVVDGRIDGDLEERLRSLNIELIKTVRHADLYEEVSCHPDMMLHHLGDEYMVYAPGVDEKVLQALSEHGFKLIQGDTCLAAKYPGDIAYNVARVGKFAFHNLKYTDKVLERELKRRGVQLVHVKQGYTKCSVSVVDENSIITADKGIAAAALEKGLEVLQIEPEDAILLPGLSNGFIGGSTAMLDRRTWAVTGRFSLLKASDRISKFLGDRNIRILSLSDKDIVDIGTILPLKAK